MASENAYVSDVDLQVEIEEREEQLYEIDGRTPVMELHESGNPDTEIIKGEDVKTKVKVKRYFYRLAATITQTWLEILNNESSQIEMGDKIGDVKGGTPFRISGDTGVEYICTGARATIVNPILKLYRHFETWHGFSKWKKVPKEWGLEQTTEIVEDEKGKN